MNAKSDPENIRQRNLISFYRYFSWSDALYRRYNYELENGDIPPGEVGSPMFWAKILMMDVGMLKCHWLASLYVVYEGWISLKLIDPVIDSLLLQDKQVNALKRFRHAVCHFQKCFFDSRILGRHKLLNSEVWSHDLQHAFEDWIRREFVIEHKDVL